jgi:hypothetical protein
VLIGNVKLWHIAAVPDNRFDEHTTSKTGGHISHLAGALLDLFFMQLLKMALI